MEAHRPREICRKEPGWTQEGCQSPECLRHKGFKPHQRTGSVSSVPPSFAGKGNTRRSRRKTANIAIPSLHPIEDKANCQNITVGTTKSESDTVIQTYKQPSKHPPNIGLSPRVSTPIEPTTSGRLPSTSVRHNHTILPLRPAHVSFEMDEIIRPMTAPLSQPPHGTHGPLSHLQSQPEPSVEQHSEMNSEMNPTILNNQHDQDVFDTEWQYIRNQRVDNWSLRAKVNEMRPNLRKKQHSISMADDKLFQYLRMQELGVTPNKQQFSNGQETILHLMQDSQNARDEYGPLEYEYHQLEDQLSRQEFELHKLEEQFFLRWKAVPTLRTEESNVPELQWGTPRGIFSLDVDDDNDTQYHPLVKKFLSKTGDLDRLRERFEDIADERSSLEEQSKTRERVGLSLATNEQIWLDGSQKAQEELSAKIKIAEKDVEDLKQQCLSMKLVDEDGEPRDFQLQSHEEETFVEDEDVDPRDQRSEYSKFPILLPRPGSEQDLRNYGLKSHEKSDLTDGRINEWLLERLRTSPLDVNLLVSTFEGKGGKVSNQYEIAVLSLWFKDGTITPRSHYRPYTSSMTTQVPLPSDHSDTTEMAFIVGTSPASPRGKLTWISQ